MSKDKKTTFGIFTESIGLYFSNFIEFTKYMTFPVLGQIAGLILVLCTTYFYSINMPKLISKYPNLDNFSTLIIISILISLPGIAIFCKAFWEYLVSYGAINSMFENMLHSGKVYDFDAHTELIKRRALPFIGLWFLFSVFALFGICPLFWVICAVFVIYFVLIFQVFTFEPELSPVGCVKKSLILIKGHFGQTFTLFCLVAALTYILIPQIILSCFDVTGISLAFSKAVMPFVKSLPEIDLSYAGLNTITHADMALFAVQVTVAQILIQYTLPLRSILWSLWYKELNNGITHQELPQKKKRKSAKRPSEKLMENTHKKYSKKKLDNNILRRAMEKDDDEE